MSPAEHAAVALGISLDEIVKIQRIGHGQTNESWLVCTREDVVVVRLGNRECLPLQVDRRSEAHVLKAVGRAGIGPQVVAWNPDEDVLITRYMGETWSAEHMHQPDRIRRLGGLFRSLHGLQRPADVRQVHLPSVISNYLETLERRRRTFARASEIRECALPVAVEIANTSAPCLCHNDVHHRNVVGAAPRLIDWEYAGIGEPYFDLASVCVQHNFAREQCENLLAAYLPAPSRSETQRLAQCCRLFRVVQELWMAVRELNLSDSCAERSVDGR